MTPAQSGARRHMRPALAAGVIGYWLLSYLEAWIFLPALQHLIWPKTIGVNGCGELGWFATDRALTAFALWFGWALNLSAGLVLLILCWWKARALLEGAFGRIAITVTLASAYPCAMLVHGLVWRYLNAALE